MTATVTPLRGRDATTVQSAVDAFLSSPRCANRLWGQRSPATWNRNSGTAMLFRRRA